jgi:hypothetical protein
MLHCLSNRVLTIVFLTGLLADLLGAAEAVDLQMVTRLREEGLSRSQVMDTAWYLTDRHGPRLTGSPQLKAAGEWARARLVEWGLENVSLEPWGEFGKGWSFEKVTVEMTAPIYMPVIAVPEAWTPGTAGVITGQPILLRSLASPADLDPHKGQLAGKILMVGEPRDVSLPFQAPATRYTDQELADLVKAPEPGDRPRPPGRPGRPRPEDGARRERPPRGERESLSARLRAEGVGAILRPGGSRGDYGVFFVGAGGSYAKDAEAGVPSLVVAVEHWNRMARLLQRQVPVTVAVEVKATFHDQDLNAFNVVAEIPGSDPELKDEVVMAGAHFDSWHAATGATDNGSSCAVIMEALRLLKVAGAHPRRTIRLALWTGEEQGLLGSRAYVKNHFADPENMELKPGHGRLSAYFNLDNGGGKIRGIYCEGNAAVRPLFQSWLEPFHDLGAASVTLRDTGGTDHQSFDRVGLPGFQFIQEPLEYITRTHHTNMDTYERLVPADLIQASVVMASFLYHAAMRDDPLPRKPLPRPRRDGEGREPARGRIARL